MMVGIRQTPRQTSHNMHITDVLHRTAVVGLVGLTCWGVYAGASVHLNILAAGRRECWYLGDK